MKFIVLMVFVGSLLFGASSSIEGSDFIPRVVNFLIFVTALYYLAGQKVKAMFVGRREDIQVKLQVASDKLVQTKKQKQSAQEKLTQANRFSEEIVAKAKDEAKFIAKKYNDQTDQLCENMKKSHEERLRSVERSMKVQITKEALEEFLDDAFDGLSQDQIMDLIGKRVGA